jgi:peptide/nickel transport system permease protein
MAIMLDYGARQSILLVIVVLGMTGWPGLSRLVRGEVLKARQMAYIQSCESLGVPLRSILFRHLLPNVSGPIFVSFAFSIAGAILAENSLSFLGFGVQAPSASWGELLKQAFADPLSYWNLMLWPGLAIFLCVTAFNFIADGIRRSIDLKS